MWFCRKSFVLIKHLFIRNHGRHTQCTHDGRYEGEKLQWVAFFQRQPEHNPPRKQVCANQDCSFNIHLSLRPNVTALLQRRIVQGSCWSTASCRQQPLVGGHHCSVEAIDVACKPSPRIKFCLFVLTGICILLSSSVGVNGLPGRQTPWTITSLPTNVLSLSSGIWAVGRIGTPSTTKLCPYNDCTLLTLLG